MTSYGILLLRAIGGFGLSVIFSFLLLLLFDQVLYKLVIIDLVLGGYIWARDVYKITLFSGIGAAVGIGTVMGWFGSDLAPEARSLRALGWLLLGVAAAWAAYGYKTVIDPYATYEYAAVAQTAILWAVLVPNIAASALGLYRYWRAGWI